MWYKSKRFSSSGVSKLINEFSTKKQRTTLISNLRGKHVFIQLKLIRRNICDEVHILLTSKRLLLTRLFPISYLIIKSSIVSHFSLLIFTATMSGHYWHYSWSQLAWCSPGQVRAQCLHQTGHGTGSVMRDQDKAKNLPEFSGRTINICVLNLDTLAVVLGLCIIYSQACIWMEEKCMLNWYNTQ